MYVLRILPLLIPVALWCASGCAGPDPGWPTLPEPEDAALPCHLPLEFWCGGVDGEPCVTYEDAQAWAASDDDVVDVPCDGGRVVYSDSGSNRYYFDESGALIGISYADDVMACMDPPFGWLDGQSLDNCDWWAK